MPFEHYRKLNDLLHANVPFVAVTLVDAQGSAPQDPGGRMLVGKDGLISGTVGGGRLENRALAVAREMLDGGAATRLVHWRLTRDLGMTCGGSVTLYFEAFNVGAWEIAVFGAGHVAQALIDLLIRLDCRIACFDTRPEWIDKLPSSPRLRRVLAPDMAAEVKNLPGNAFVLVMTMGHTTDLPILIEIFKTRDFPYVGAIGSRAKAAFFRRGLREAGIAPPARFHCPVGLELGSNHPAEIAVSIAAQLIMEREKVRGVRAPVQDQDCLSEGSLTG